MAGYNYSKGMSNNAVEAYEDGKVTLSNIKAEWLKENDINLSLKDAKYLMREKKCRYDSWHHTSKHYNETYFFNAENFLEAIEKYGSAAAITEERKSFEQESKEKEKNDDGVAVVGFWEQWVKCGKRWTKEREDFTGILKNGWILLPNGKKKNASGNHIFWEKAPKEELQAA